jgi:hypothetical protein
MPAKFQRKAKKIYPDYTAEVSAREDQQPATASTTTDTADIVPITSISAVAVLDEWIKVSDAGSEFYFNKVTK